MVQPEYFWQFYLLERSHFSRRCTAGTTRRSQKSLYAGNRLIQKDIGALTLRGATPKRFMLRPYRRFHPLLSRASHRSSIHF